MQERMSEENDEDNYGKRHWQCIRSGKPRFAINQRYADCAKLFILKYFNFVLHLIFPFWQQCCMCFRFVLIREQGNKGIPQKRRTDISNKGDGICMTGIPGRFHRSRYRSGYTAFLSSMPQTPMSILLGTFCLPPFCDRNRKSPVIVLLRAVQ